MCLLKKAAGSLCELTCGESEELEQMKLIYQQLGVKVNGLTTTHAEQRCDWCYIFQRAPATQSLEGKLPWSVSRIHATLRLLTSKGPDDI